VDGNQTTNGVVEGGILLLVTAVRNLA
jgi:hypothetical protein